MQYLAYNTCASLFMYSISYHIINAWRYIKKLDDDCLTGWHVQIHSYSKFTGRCVSTSILHSMQCRAVLWCAVLYYTVLHCTMLHCTVLCFTVLYCTMLSCTMPMNCLTSIDSREKIQSKWALPCMTTSTIVVPLKMELTVGAARSVFSG